MAEEPLSGAGVIVTSVRPDSRGYETPGKRGAKKPAVNPDPQQSTPHDPAAQPEAQ
jgi:hypothetical protein